MQSPSSRTRKSIWPYLMILAVIITIIWLHQQTVTACPALEKIPTDDMDQSTFQLYLQNC